MEVNLKALMASRKLHDLGFKNIYLETADHDGIKLSDAPWLLGVLDKGYPIRVAP